MRKDTAAILSDLERTVKWLEEYEQWMKNKKGPSGS